jgi:mitogen-activated protein kinase kinase kinase
MAVAVKVLGRSRGKDGDASVKELENEIAVMARLDHPNIVRYLGCQADREALYIFQEWVPCGSISDMLKAYGPLGDAVTGRYLFQILSGLA